MPVWAEFFIIILMAFGFGFLNALLVLAYLFEGSFVPGSDFSDEGVWWLLQYEGIVLVLAIAFLWVRGFDFSLLGFRPTWSQTLIGLGLGLFAIFLFQFTWEFCEFILGDLDVAAVPLLENVSVGFGAVMGIVILNSLYEELFVTGYVVARLEPLRGAVFALNASVALRMSYHLYQGFQGVISIIPLGLLFAGFFVYTRRLWPLMVGHGTINFIYFGLATGN